jgi:RNA polymerase sigma-70 factor, ECF subfamily
VSRALAEEGVRNAWREGQRAWPGIALTEQAFAEHVASLPIDETALEAALAERGADLFIAAACTRRDQQAIVRFDAQYLAPLERYVNRFRLTAERVAELRQQLRLHVLLGADPAIARYRGSGPLAAWVRVVAVRAAVDLTRADHDPRTSADAEALDRLIAPELGPEGRTIVTRYRDQVQTALREALATMSDQDKTLLRLHFLDGASVIAIGRIYGVHRATVTRWLVTLRRDLLERVRASLALPGTPTPSELQSLMKVLQNEIELSLHRLLG